MLAGPPARLKWHVVEVMGKKSQMEVTQLLVENSELDHFVKTAVKRESAGPQESVDTHFSRQNGVTFPQPLEA